MPQPKPKKSFYTTKEVADVIGVTAPTIIKWVKEGRVGASKTPGGHRRIAHAELVRLSEECGQAFRAYPTEVQVADTRILVVDHEEDFADMVAEFLDLQPDITAVCTIELVDVGIQLVRFRPTVVLCAIDLPGISLASIAQQVAELGARFVLMTNVRTRHQISLCEDLAGDVLIEKPMTLDSLLQVIRPT